MPDEDGKARASSKPARKKTMRSQPAAAPAKPAISDIIGRRLRTYYDEVSAQPVPDRFLELLARLEAETSRKARERP